MAEELLHKHFAPYTPKDGEDYMSADQLKHFRAMLESVKKELSEDIERTVHTMQDEATVFADPNDRASQETDIAIELRNRDRERKYGERAHDRLFHLSEPADRPLRQRGNEFQLVSSK